jgi:hypothetical protein
MAESAVATESARVSTAMRVQGRTLKRNQEQERGCRHIKALGLLTLIAAGIMLLVGPSTLAWDGPGTRLRFRACGCQCATTQPGPPFAFRADDEPARTAFLRLVRSRPARNHLVRSEGAYHLVASEPGGYHWLMKCQPGESWCFINLNPIPDRR